MDLPTILSEDLYDTPPSPLVDQRETVLQRSELPELRCPELRCAASEARMESRKIKVPCSRRKGNSPILASAPASTEAGIDTSPDLAGDLNGLNITSAAN
jgi:hypothetical protein